MFVSLGLYYFLVFSLGTTTPRRLSRGIDLYPREEDRMGMRSQVFTEVKMWVVSWAKHNV